MPTFLSKIIEYYNDREYFSLLFKTALPIAAQSLLMSSLNMVNALMVGQLGETSIAVIHLTGQVFFLLTLALFGISSGSAIFMAQLWGKKDVVNIRRVLGLSLSLGLASALVFSALAILIPEAILGLYTQDPTVIRLGAEYLRIFGWSYPIFSISFTFATVLRSTGNVRAPLFVSIFSLGLDVSLVALLTFGLFGLPRMGILGVAVAGLTARLAECIGLLLMSYRQPATNPAAASWRELIDFTPDFIVKVLKPVLPVIVNEVLWSLGITTYTIIYGHIGTDAVSAINMVGAIDQLAFFSFFGLGSATAILVGNLIGKGELDRAYQYGGRSLWLQMFGGALVGLLLFLFAENIFSLYHVSETVRQNAWLILQVLCMGLWLRTANHLIIIGILRAGGDTMFSLWLDGLAIWVIGVPLTALGAFVLGWPIHLVYMMTLSEELAKFFVGMVRYHSKKWIHELGEQLAEHAA